MKKALLLCIGFFLLIYWFTHGLTNTFFQQDEWNGFGYVIYLRQSPWWAWFNLLGPSHFIPLSQFYWFVMYRLFGYEASYYALNAITLHAIASYLVYLVAKRFTGNNPVAILTSFLFATNSRSAQAFTHLAVFPATITSFIIIMIFFLYLTTLRAKTTFQKKDLLILLGIFFTSVFLREDGLILPALLPVYLWLFTPKVFQRRNLWFFAIFYACIIGFFGFRVYLQTHAATAIAITAGSFKKIYLYNAISLPFKLVVQNIFEGIDLFNIFWDHKQLVYTEYHHQITVGLMYTVVYDFVILVVFTILAGLFLFVTRNYKNPIFWKPILFCIAWILISAWLLSVAGRPMNVVESRYLYLSSFAVLLIFSQLLVFIFQKNYIGKIFVVLSIGALLVMSYKEVQITIKRYVFQSQARKHILVDLLRLHPTIPKDTVFYVTCSKVCYRNNESFGVPDELVLPYTSGPGWIFLLHYAKQNEKAYAQFFTLYQGKEFLWDYGAEGFRKEGDYSFGFYRVKRHLEQALLEEKFSIDSVIGLSYDESDFSLHDNTKEVRADLQRFEATASATLQ